MNKIHFDLSRRQTLFAGLALALAPKPSRAELLPAGTTVASAPLSYLDPARPLDANYAIVRPTLFDVKMAKIAIERCWNEYNKTKEAKYAEWAALYCFNYWRLAQLGEPRIQAARIGLKLSQQHKTDYPGLVAGHFWTATFLGLESISRGILDAAHLIPEYQRHLAEAEKIDSTYFYAAPIIAQAKLFVKAPKFPVSVGNLEKGLEYLEKARPYQEHIFALWYVFKAEADYLISGDKELTFANFEQMLKKVKPIDSATQYTLEMSIQDAKGLRQAVEAGTYNKYKWDPLLTPLKITT